MYTFKSRKRVSIVNKEKRLGINILGEESTTVDTWCRNTGDEVGLTTRRGAVCSLQASVDSPPVPLGHSGSTKQQFLKESEQLRIKGMWRLVSSLKKNELNISMT